MLIKTIKIKHQLQVTKKNKSLNQVEQTNLKLIMKVNRKIKILMIAQKEMKREKDIQTTKEIN